MEIYKGDRLGLVLAFWGLALILGRVQISQTDYTEDGTTFGSVLNHVSVGRKTHGRRPLLSCLDVPFTYPLSFYLGREVNYSLT